MRFSWNSHGVKNPALRGGAFWQAFVKAEIPHDQNYFLPAGVQKCTGYRSKFT
jgi:hypothetical protein